MIYILMISCFYFREDDSIGFVDNFINECESLVKNTHAPCKDDSLRINISNTCDYDCFNFWEEDSIVNRDILVGNHRDSSLFEDEYDSFKFLENESYDLGRDELIGEGDITSLYSEKEKGDSFRELEWGNENRECENVTPQPYTS